MAVRDCSFKITELENDSGYGVEGVFVTCNWCGHVVQSFGTSESSIKRCLYLMRKECPEGESNFYQKDTE